MLEDDTKEALARDRKFMVDSIHQSDAELARIQPDLSQARAEGPLPDDAKIVDLMLRNPEHFSGGEDRWWWLVEPHRIISHLGDQLRNIEKHRRILDGSEGVLPAASLGSVLYRPELSKIEDLDYEFERMRRGFAKSTGGTSTYIPPLGPGGVELIPVRVAPLRDQNNQLFCELRQFTCPEPDATRVGLDKVLLEVSDPCFIPREPDDREKRASKAQFKGYDVAEVAHCRPTPFSIPCATKGKGSYSFPYYNATVSHGPRPDMTGWSAQEKDLFWQYGSHRSWEYVRQVMGFRPYRGFAWYTTTLGNNVAKEHWLWLPPAFRAEGHNNPPGHYHCLYPKCGFDTTNDQSLSDHVRVGHCWIGLKCPRCCIVLDGLTEARIHIQYCTGVFVKSAAEGPVNHALPAVGPFGPGGFRAPPAKMTIDSMLGQVFGKIDSESTPGWVSELSARLKAETTELLKSKGILKEKKPRRPSAGDP